LANFFIICFCPGVLHNHSACFTAVMERLRIKDLQLTWLDVNVSCDEYMWMVW